MTELNFKGKEFVYTTITYRCRSGLWSCTLKRELGSRHSTAT